MSKKNRLRSSLWRSVRSTIHRPINNTRHTQNRVSDRTISYRWTTLKKMVEHIYEAGFKPEKVQNLRIKHLDAVFAAWEREEHQHSTLQTELSVLRYLVSTINRPDLLKHIDEYAERKTKEHRKALARYGKPREKRAWSIQDERVAATLLRIIEKDSLVALQLALQHAFGLRVRESFRLRPAESYQAGSRLELSRGTKGGRPRTVPVETKEQRKLLEHALEVAELNGGSMMPKEYSETSWRHHYYRVLRDCGFTRQDLGITSHGLRHDYAQRMYKKVSGLEAPVNAGTRYTDGEAGTADLVARLEVAEVLGHGRYDITRHYLDQIIELDTPRHLGMRRKRGSAWQNRARAG